MWRGKLFLNMNGQRGKGRALSIGEDLGIPDCLGGWHGTSWGSAECLLAWRSRYIAGLPVIATPTGKFRCVLSQRWGLWDKRNENIKWAYIDGFISSFIYLFINLFIHIYYTRIKAIFQGKSSTDCLWLLSRLDCARSTPSIFVRVTGLNNHRKRGSQQ